MWRQSSLTQFNQLILARNRLNKLVVGLLSRSTVDFPGFFGPIFLRLVLKNIVQFDELLKSSKVTVSLISVLKELSFTLDSWVKSTAKKM